MSCYESGSDLKARVLELNKIVDDLNRDVKVRAEIKTVLEY